MESSPYQGSSWPLSPCLPYCFQFPKPHNFLEDRRPPMAVFLPSSCYTGWHLPGYLTGRILYQEHTCPKNTLLVPPQFLSPQMCLIYHPPAMTPPSRHLIHFKSMHEWGRGTQPKDSFCPKLGTGCFSPVVDQLQKFHQLDEPFSINTAVCKVRFADAHP